MDPLSIIASSITLLGASISVTDVIISVISGIRNLPAELAATSVDVAEFRTLLVQLEASIRLEDVLLRSLPEDAFGGLRAIVDTLPAASVDGRKRIEDTNAKLHEVEILVLKIGSTKYLGYTKLIERKRLQQIRQELRDLKLSLGAHFSIKSGRISLQSLVSLQHISRCLVQASQESTSQRNVLTDIQQYMRHSQSIEDEQRRLRGLIETLNENISFNCRLTMPNESPVSHRLLPPPPPAASNEIQFPTTNPVPERATISTQGEEYCNSVFKLDISRFRKHSCRAFCSCACHRRTRQKARSGLFGSLAVGYSSLPFFVPACTDQSCTNPTSFSATVTYFFPTWLFLRMISLVFVTSIFGDPFIGIKIRPMTNVFTIFRLATVGNLGGLRNLLTHRGAHPSSSFYGGWTALHYAISNGHASVCRLLLQQKADPMIEDGGNSQSALEMAWMKILGKSFKPQLLLEFQSIFTDRECLEEMGFTRIHKLVLELEHGKLADEIQAADLAVINTPDFGGRTPLSWAAQRGDLLALTSLLESGADPNLTTRSGMAPLHYAVESFNPACIQVLVNYGADVHAVDYELQTALHFACKRQNDAAWLVPLVNSGVNVNCKTEYDFTPLIFAILHNNLAALSYLLDHGADIDARGQYGKTPPMYAIEYNSHGCLRLLLSHGADCSVTSDVGSTIAHFAARYADLTTLQILNESDLPKFSLERLEVIDREGDVIPDVLNRRLRDDEFFDDSFNAAFNLFMEKVLDTSGLSEVSDDRETDSPVWEDTVEWPEDMATSVN